MAVAFQSVSAGAAGTDSTAESDAASGVVSGDCLLLALIIRSATTRVTPTTPSGDGWSLVNSALDGATVFSDIYVYSKIADGTVADIPVISLSGTPTGWHTRTMRFDGTDGTTPVDTSAKAEDDSKSSATASIPTATAARNGSMAVCCATKLAGSDDALTWPGTWSEIFEDYAPGGWRSNATAGYNAIDAGAMASEDISGWDSASIQPVQRVTVILQPPASGGVANSYYYQRNQ